ncbi:hypothetical protein OCU04_006312 [Sclerotinia nivalis]|uniref:Uncharacterized protein n=1 Tax=Sclerotinia nivalis TaxID=352851 RepID=A0A9X0AMS1_9HELO|nr:hypothetical protein OCU04_006312 [Sclerotinia nivalis]
MAVPQDIPIRLQSIKAYIEGNKSVVSRPATSWAIESMLKKMNRILSDSITPGVLLDKVHLEELFVCFNDVTSTIDSLRSHAVQPVDSSYLEPEAQVPIITNTEEANKVKSTEPSDCRVVADVSKTKWNNVSTPESNELIRGASFLNSFQPIVDSVPNDTPKEPSSQNSNSQHATLLTSTPEHKENPKGKKKKKSKNKTSSENVTGEVASMPIVPESVPLQPLPMARGYTPPAISTPIVVPSPFKAEVGTSMLSLTMTLYDKPSHSIIIEQKAVGEDLLQVLMDKSKKVEGENVEFQKALAEMSRKYEAIKFENRNLKTDRNKEVEKLRKEHSLLNETSSNNTAELSKSRSKVHALESEIMEKSELLEEFNNGMKLLRAEVARHSDEMKHLRQYQPNFDAHICIFEKKKTSMSIEDNHAEFLSSTRHECNIEDSPSATSQDITNNTLLSEEGRKTCVVMEDLRKDNAELRARCKWYWDLLQASNQTKKSGGISEAEWAKRKPLFDVGVAVRKRFLEQSKSTLPYREAQSVPDHTIIREGNERCHRGNAIADAALFEFGFLTGPDNETAYRDVYHIWADDVANHHQEIIEAMELCANIGTVKATRASQEYRNEAFQCWNSLIALRETCQTEEDFIVNPDRDIWLSRLRQLSRDIVRIDRDRGYRYSTEEAEDTEQDEWAMPASEQDDWARLAAETQS